MRFASSFTVIAHLTNVLLLCGLLVSEIRKLFWNGCTHNEAMAEIRVLVDLSHMLPFSIAGNSLSIDITQTYVE